MDGTFIVPSPTGSRWAELGSASLELARQTQGRLLEKHILSVGTLIHPKTGERINVDDAYLSTIVTNFNNNVCDIVQVPLANDDNQHVENADVNKGEVTQLRKRNGKLYAVVDAREDAEKFGKTYLGASAFLSTNYTDSRDGKKKGPTLLHVAVTNRPYVVGLEPYKEIIAATATSDNDAEIVVLGQEEEEPTVDPKEELATLLATLKDKHGIDVAELQVQAAAQPVQGEVQLTAGSPTVDVAALTTALTAALANTPLGAQLTASNSDSINLDDVVGSVVELSRQNAVLAAGYDGMRRERAEEVVDKYVSDGYIFPKQRNFAVNLRLTGKPEEWDEFLPADKVVLTDEQSGVTPPKDERESQQQSEEVVRLTDQYKEYFAPQAASNGRGARK
jgi:Mu-like prophage I protein